MSVVTRVNQVRKAVKNVGRAREIATLMAQFGFTEVLKRSGLSSFNESDPSNTDESFNRNAPTPVRLRLLFERLGPTFIKLGQILAGRPDLVPAEIVYEFKKLQDRVEPVSILQIKPVIEEGLGRKLEDAFSSFDTEPMATASIAQVHAARTLDGDEVVVKVLKPGVEKHLKQDLELLEFFTDLSERFIPELSHFRPKQILREFRKALLKETDFGREVKNIQRFRENFQDSTFLVIPKPFLDLCSKDVITMERIRGVKLSDEKGVRDLGIDTSLLMNRGTEAFFKSVMVDGLFHSDPHGGNLFVLPDARLALIDFGSVGYLSEKSRRAIVNLFLALLTQDYDWLVREYLNLSPATGMRSSRQLEKLSNDIHELFAPYHGLPLKEIPSGKLLMEGTTLAFKNNITLPLDLVMVFKAIMTLEGMARSLDPDFDLVNAGGRFAKTAIKTLYKPEFIIKELLFTARDLLSLGRSIPRQIAESIRQLESGELRLKLHIDNVETLARSHRSAQATLSVSIIFSTLLAFSLIVAAFPTELAAWSQFTLWTSTIVLGLYLSLRILRTGH